jgi:hypothetical protein
VAAPIACQGDAAERDVSCCQPNAFTLSLPSLPA